MKLVLSNVFTTLFGSSRGPEVAMFKKFQSSWKLIDKKTYDVASEDMFNEHTSVIRIENVNYCKAALEGVHVREDYEEFLKLCLIFLGGANKENASFRAPGAFHHARWLAKAIYSIKIHLFQQQFPLSGKEKVNVKELALFVSLVYVRFWHEATLPIKAPLNDIQLIENLDKYPNTVVAKAASTAFCATFGTSLKF